MYWKTRFICFKCYAKKTLTVSAGERMAQGNLYTCFGSDFGARSTNDFICDVLPENPVPLILLHGFHVDWLKFCLMHTLHLGVYLVLVAEGLLFLAEKQVTDYGGSVVEALRSSYNKFRRWCRSSKIVCSTRAWRLHQFHLGPDPQHPTEHPWLNIKAYNARCVLAWLAESWLNNNIPSVQTPEHFSWKSC